MTFGNFLEVVSNTEWIGVWDGEKYTEEEVYRWKWHYKKWHGKRIEKVSVEHGQLYVIFKED